MVQEERMLTTTEEWMVVLMKKICILRTVSEMVISWRTDRNAWVVVVGQEKYMASSG